MRLWLSVLAVVLACPLAAIAQEPSPPPTVTLSADLAMRLNRFLLSGGSSNEGAGLSRELIAAASEPDRAAQVQKRIDEAVKAATEKKPEPAPAAEPSKP
jgi:hypothetical protein